TSTAPGIRNSLGTRKSKAPVAVNAVHASRRLHEFPSVLPTAAGSDDPGVCAPSESSKAPGSDGADDLPNSRRKRQRTFMTTMKAESSTASDEPRPPAG